MEKVASNSKFDGHSTEIIQKTKIKAPVGLSQMKLTNNRIKLDIKLILFSLLFETSLKMKIFFPVLHMRNPVEGSL